METPPSDDNLISTIEGWYEVVTKDAEGVAHTHRLYKHSTKTRPKAEDIEKYIIRQAAPVKITPSKRKIPKRDEYKMEIALGDTHHPFTNRARLELAHLAIRELQPDGVTFIGDDVDMTSFSVFEKRPEWAESTQKGIDEFNQTLARVRADVPEAKIIAHMGNHDFRLEREIRKYNLDLMNLRRAGDSLGALALSNLLRCNELGVEYISGYPSAEYWYNDNFKSYHGNTTNGSGLAASKEIKSETVNFMHGHTHNAGIIYKTFRQGREEKTIAGIELGTFADSSLIPSGSYSVNEAGGVLRQALNWQTVLGVIYYNDEEVIPQLIPITDTHITINGRQYRS